MQKQLSKGIPTILVALRCLIQVAVYSEMKKLIKNNTFQSLVIIEFKYSEKLNERDKHSNHVEGKFIN